MSRAILVAFALLAAAHCASAGFSLLYNGFTMVCTTPRSTTFPYKLTVDSTGPALKSLTLAMNTSYTCTDHTLAYDSVTGLSGVKFTQSMTPGNSYALNLTFSEKYDDGAVLVYAAVDVNDVVYYGEMDWGGPFPFFTREEPDTITMNLEAYDFKTCYGNPSGCVKPNPDFQNDTECSVPGDVGEKGIAATTLGGDRIPVYADCLSTAGKTRCISVATNLSFSQWFRNTPNVNYQFAISVPFSKNSAGLYEYTNMTFFPLDGMGYGDEGAQDASTPPVKHNFGYCVASHQDFRYHGGEVFHFLGDDDVFVFIDNKLALDLGGPHTKLSQDITLDTLGLKIGTKYNFDFFYCERHTTESEFSATTSVGLYACDSYDPCGYCRVECNKVGASTTVDSDGDNVCDCLDDCPLEPSLQKVSPSCGCRIACTTGNTTVGAICADSLAKCPTCASQLNESSCLSSTLNCSWCAYDSKCRNISQASVCPTCGNYTASSDCSNSALGCVWCGTACAADWLSCPACDGIHVKQDCQNSPNCSWCLHDSTCRGAATDASCPTQCSNLTSNATCSTSGMTCTWCGTACAANKASCSACSSFHVKQDCEVSLGCAWCLHDGSCRDTTSDPKCPQCANLTDSPTCSNSGLSCSWCGISCAASKAACPACSTIQSGQQDCDASLGCAWCKYDLSCRNTTWAAQCPQCANLTSQPDCSNAASLNCTWCGATCTDSVSLCPTCSSLDQNMCGKSPRNCAWCGYTCADSAAQCPACTSIHDKDNCSASTQPLCSWCSNTVGCKPRHGCSCSQFGSSDDCSNASADLVIASGCFWCGKRCDETCQCRGSQEDVCDVASRCTWCPNAATGDYCTSLQCSSSGTSTYDVKINITNPNSTEISEYINEVADLLNIDADEINITVTPNKGGSGSTITITVPTEVVGNLTDLVTNTSSPLYDGDLGKHIIHDVDISTALVVTQLVLAISLIVAMML